MEQAQLIPGLGLSDNTLQIIALLSVSSSNSVGDRLRYRLSITDTLREYSTSKWRSIAKIRNTIPILAAVTVKVQPAFYRHTKMMRAIKVVSLYRL